MKKFQEYNINSKIIIILVGTLLVNVFCMGVLYFFKEKETQLSEDSIHAKNKLSAYYISNVGNHSVDLNSYQYGDLVQPVDFSRDNKINTTNSKYLLAFFFLSSIASCGLCYIVMKKHVVKPVLTILDTSNDLASGNIPALVEQHSGDEFGQITSSINKIIKNKTELSDFVKKIGNGEPDAQYELLGEKDVIGSSLISMRDKIQKMSQEESKRSWTNEGVAIFSDLLMEEYSLTELSEKLLNGLVKYISANQGGLFIKETNAEDETVFEMYACYAWNKKRFLDRQIKLNEGLVGQAAIEKETIFLTEVPNDYIKITSGMGDANPGSILIVPLKVNDTVHGVLELASFKVFEKHEIDFVEKLAENIASTISNTKINENTKRLLEETKAMNENLQAQEEELRQNAEELNATQESLERAKDSMRIQIMELEFEKIKNEGILEGCLDAIISFRENGTIDFFNKASEELWSVGKKMAIGRNIKEFISIEIIGKEEGMSPYFIQNNHREKLDIRKEIQLHINDTPTTVLITVSKVKAGEEYFFTAFIQSISVELF
jgi:PAS domain-containing protein